MEEKYILLTIIRHLKIVPKSGILLLTIVLHAPLTIVFHHELTIFLHSVDNNAGPRDQVWKSPVFVAAKRDIE